MSELNKTIRLKTITYKVFCFVFLLVGLSGCDFLTEPGGVLLKDEINPSIKNYIRNNVSEDLVEEGLIAYYDTTISLDKSQSYILTNKSLVIYCAGFEDWETWGFWDCLGTDPHGTNIIPLKSINKIYETDEYYDGTDCGFMVEPCFYVSVSADKEYFFSIASLNNGDLFLSELIKAWESEVF